MGRIGCFVLLIVLVVLAYDQYRIEQMRNEVRAISGKVHVESTDKRTGPSNADLVTALAEVERHTKRAQELIKNKKNVEARAELDKALKSLRSANTVSKDIIGDVAESLGKARKNAVDVFQKAWKDISEEAKTKK